MIVGLTAPGAMGAAIGAVLVKHGAEVRTSLAGRSAASAERARSAGLSVAATDADLADVDLILSIVPPAEALVTARRLAADVARSKRRPVYVDCNAVNPATAHAVQTVIEGAGGRFVDAGIIGLPPREGGRGPILFVSGPDAVEVEALTPLGLEVRRLTGPAGAASALKMCYAGITKGLIGLASAMIFNAARAGIGPDLHEELARSQGALLAGFSRSIPDMFSKAGRWVAEMQEIAGLCPDGSPERALYEAMAAFYSRLAKEGTEGDFDTLTTFFAGQGSPQGEGRA